MAGLQMQQPNIIPALTNIHEFHKKLSTTSKRSCQFHENEIVIFAILELWIKRMGKEYIVLLYAIFWSTSDSKLVRQIYSTLHKTGKSMVLCNKIFEWSTNFLALFRALILNISKYKEIPCEYSFTCKQWSMPPTSLRVTVDFRSTKSAKHSSVHTKIPLHCVSHTGCFCFPCGSCVFLFLECPALE